MQLVRHYEHVERSYFKVETYAYRGPAIFDGKAYRKLDIEDEEDGRSRAAYAGGWMAALQHHFVAAAVPPAGATYDYQLSLRCGQRLRAVAIAGRSKTVPAGGTQHVQRNIVRRTEAAGAAGGNRSEAASCVADYGKLTIIAQPLFWLLEKVHSFVGNWGWRSSSSRS